MITTKPELVILLCHDIFNFEWKMTDAWGDIGRRPASDVCSSHVWDAPLLTCLCIITTHRHTWIKQQIQILQYGKRAMWMQLQLDFLFPRRRRRRHGTSCRKVQGRKLWHVCSKDFERTTRICRVQSWNGWSFNHGLYPPIWKDCSAIYAKCNVSPCSFDCQPMMPMPWGLDWHSFKKHPCPLAKLWNGLHLARRDRWKSLKEEEAYFPIPLSRIKFVDDHLSNMHVFESWQMPMASLLEQRHDRK